MNLSRLAPARAWQTNTALFLLGFGLFLLSLQLVSEYDHFTIGFSGVSGWSVILYILSIFLVLTQPVDRFTFPLILAFAILCRLAVLYADPYLSSDVYRYVWDGIVQHAHVSPYRYVPGDHALAFLRERNQDIFDNINRRDYARTIYPPAAQALFFLITWISPTLTFMKTAMVLFEGLTLWATLQIFRHLGIRREQALLYAWCPLLIWEIAGSGHLDSVAMSYITLALLFRLRRRPILTGLFLGLAVMTKMYPLILLPALMMKSGAPHLDSEMWVSDRSKNLPSQTWSHLYLQGWDWTLPGTTLAVILLGYAAYSSVGSLVFGFLPGYVQEEGMATGVRYFLLELAQGIPGLHHLPTAAFLAFSALVFLALTLYALRTAAEPAGARFLRPAFALASALMLLFSPHYAWYIAWLVPFFTLLSNLPVLAYLLGFFYLYTTALAAPGPKMFLANQILYALVAFACLLHLALRRLSPSLRPTLP